MRITQIMLSKGFGGAERAFVDTVMALAVRGHAVQVICHRAFCHRKVLEQTAGVQVVPVRPLNQYDFISVLQMRSVMKLFRPDVVHIHLNRAARLGGAAASLAGIPWVGTFHNYYSLTNYTKAAAFIAIAEDVRNHLLQLGVHASKVTVVPNFSRVASAEKAHRRRNGPTRILSYGRFVHKKGFDVLLRAFKSVLDSGEQAELILGGVGPEDGSLRALCRELGVEPHVRFAGWIEDVQVELDQADLFVLPSRDEPFGIVMLEAMARGVPIVTTRSQGPSQVLSDQTAFFVEIDSVGELAAAMRMTLGNSQAAFEKASAALALYRSAYQESAVLPKLEAFYLSVSSR